MLFSLHQRELGKYQSYKTTVTPESNLYQLLWRKMARNKATRKLSLLRDNTHRDWISFASLVCKWLTYFDSFICFIFLSQRCFSLELCYLPKCCHKVAICWCSYVLSHPLGYGDSRRRRHHVVAMKNGNKTKLAFVNKRPGRSDRVMCVFLWVSKFSDICV